MSELTPNIETVTAAHPLAASPSTGPSATAEVLTCTICGGENSLDSHFCRHCGKSLLPVPSDTPASSGAALSESSATSVPAAPAAPAAAPAASPSVASGAPSVNGAADVSDALQDVSDLDDPDEPDISPEEIDLRRSRQLLDRALGLSEQGDRASAMLSCRQAIALAPGAPGGYSMLGLLLERNGDIEHAIAAYEKVLEMAPNSPLERDSLHRLRGAVNHNATAPVFHFNSTELFDADDEIEALPPLSGAPSLVAPVADTARPSAGAPAPAAAPAPRRVVPPSRIGATAGMTVPAIPPLGSIDDDYLTVDEPRDRKPGLLRALRNHSSFYVQAVPLMAVSVVALGFLLWARGFAMDRAQPGDTAGRAPGGMVTDATVRPDGPEGTDGRGQAASGTPGQPIAAPPPTTGGLPVPISNGAQPPAANTAARSSQAAPAGATSPAAPPRFPDVPPSGPDEPRTAREEGHEVLTGLRPFPITGTSPPAAPTPVPVLPSASGSNEAVGRSTNGSPVSSGGAGTRGYVRVTGSRPPAGSAPARPENRVRAAEDAAREDAASGRTDRAIERTTTAIDNGRGGDTGWRYQQRALLHLENGNNSQAIDDFQTAIAAYRDQIARNVRPAEARSGIAACQSGLRLAQSRTG